MSDAACQVYGLPAQGDQLALAHGGLECQAGDRKQGWIPCLGTGLQQALLFAFFPAWTELQPAVAGPGVRGQLDVSDRVVHLDAPFPPGHLEEIGDDDEI